MPAPFLSDKAFKMYCPKSSVPINAPMITMNNAKTIVWFKPSIMWGNAKGNSILVNLWNLFTPDIVAASCSPAGLHDAATMSGVNKFQRLTKIEFPLAFPHMMLGLNQTIVFALFMVIIGAFIGTEDLGQYILKALSDKNGAGIGLTLGICVAFIGLIFDNLIRTWVEKRKKHLGID